MNNQNIFATKTLKQQRKSRINLQGRNYSVNYNALNIRTARHCIELVNFNAALVHSSLCRAGQKAREFVKAEIMKMFEENIIKPVQTERASQIVFVQKKDDTIGFCVDYRKSNAHTKQTLYSIPQINRLICTLGEATSFSKMHAYSWYWRIKTDKPDRDKTAFTSQSGLYRFKLMSFEL